jgi:hypothetical protein
MFAILHVLGTFVADMFKSWWLLEAENLFLRHQLNIALRQAPPRLRLRCPFQKFHPVTISVVRQNYCMICSYRSPLAGSFSKRPQSINLNPKMKRQQGAYRTSFAPETTVTSTIDRA